ncbi:hypothetical protein ACS8MQ_02995 [Pseudomonas sp. MAHUQ-62]|uniref:hypothetical protein n=1 Tax=Pseudomonas sp. GCM10023245 TaxID=3252652 RepID=UPI00361D5D27
MPTSRIISLPDDSRKGDPNLLTMSSQLVGLVAAAAVDGDIEKGAWVAQNATQYNYLTHAQEAEKDYEMEGCKEDKLCRVEKATKWALIDAQQDLGIVVGVGGGIGLSAAETVEGVLELVQHLPETVKALKQLASSPEFRQQFTDSYVSDLEQRAARLTQAYNDAGWQGSVTAGVEGARFAVELVGVLTAVRGTAQVAAKLPDAAKQVVNAIAEAPASGGWKAQVGAVGDLGKLEVPGGAKGTATRQLPSSLPENLTGYANPADIRFTQNSVSNTFKDGQSLQATIDGLKSGKISPDDLPPVRVFEKDGVIYSLDNRRLLAASQTGVPVKVVPATQAEVAKEAWKMTAPNGGTIICVRGACQ